MFAPIAHNDLALKYHYSHMARRNAGEHLSKEQVKLKKYFYILRPLLAIRYIEQGLGLPPVRFEQLVSAVAPMEIRKSISDLIKIKKQTIEVGTGSAVPALNKFIYSELDKHNEAFSGQGRPDLHDNKKILDELNSIFRQAIC